MLVLTQQVNQTSGARIAICSNDTLNYVILANIIFYAEMVACPIEKLYDGSGFGYVLYMFVCIYSIKFAKQLKITTQSIQ